MDDDRRVRDDGERSVRDVNGQEARCVGKRRVAPVKLHHDGFTSPRFVRQTDGRADRPHHPFRYYNVVTNDAIEINLASSDQVDRRLQHETGLGLAWVGTRLDWLQFSARAKISGQRLPTNLGSIIKMGQNRATLDWTPMVSIKNRLDFAQLYQRQSQQMPGVSDSGRLPTFRCSRVFERGACRAPDVTSCVFMRCHFQAIRHTPRGETGSGEGRLVLEMSPHYFSSQTFLISDRDIGPPSPRPSPHPAHIHSNWENSPKKTTDQRVPLVRHDSHSRKSGVTRPEIEPDSPWWQARSLTAQPPQPPSFNSHLSLVHAPPIRNVLESSKRLTHSRLHSSDSHSPVHSSHEHLARRRPAILCRRPHFTSVAHTRPGSLRQRLPATGLRQPSPRIFPKSLDASRRDDVPSSLTITFLCRRPIRRNPSIGEGPPTAAVHYSRVSQQRGSGGNKRVSPGEGRCDVSPPPQRWAAAPNMNQFLTRNTHVSDDNLESLWIIKVGGFRRIHRRRWNRRRNRLLVLRRVFSNLLVIILLLNNQRRMGSARFTVNLVGNYVRALWTRALEEGNYVPVRPLMKYHVLTPRTISHVSAKCHTLRGLLKRDCTLCNSYRHGCHLLVGAVVTSLSPGRGGLAVSLLASHLGKPCSISGRVTPIFSRVEIVPDDAAGRRVFSGISRFLRPFISALLHIQPLSSVLKTSLLTAAQISSLAHSLHIQFKYIERKTLKDSHNTQSGFFLGTCGQFSAVVIIFSIPLRQAKKKRSRKKRRDSEDVSDLSTPSGYKDVILGRDNPWAYLTVVAGGGDGTACVVTRPRSVRWRGEWRAVVFSDEVRFCPKGTSTKCQPVWLAGVRMGTKKNVGNTHNGGQSGGGLVLGAAKLAATPGEVESCSCREITAGGRRPAGSTRRDKPSQRQEMCSRSLEWHNNNFLPFLASPSRLIQPSLPGPLVPSLVKPHDPYDFVRMSFRTAAPLDIYLYTAAPLLDSLATELLWPHYWVLYPILQSGVENIKLLLTTGSRETMREKRGEHRETPEIKGGGNRDPPTPIPVETHRPAASSGTICSCENLATIAIPEKTHRLVDSSAKICSFENLATIPIPEKIHRLVASSGTIPTFDNPGATPPGIEPVSSSVGERGEVRATPAVRACRKARWLQGMVKDLGSRCIDKVEVDAVRTGLRALDDVRRWRAFVSSRRPFSASRLVGTTTCYRPNPSYTDATWPPSGLTFGFPTKCVAEGSRFSQRVEHSPPTKANRVRLPAGPVKDFRTYINILHCSPLDVRLSNSGTEASRETPPLDLPPSVMSFQHLLEQIHIWKLCRLLLLCVETTMDENIIQILKKLGPQSILHIRRKRKSSGLQFAMNPFSKMPVCLELCTKSLMLALGLHRSLLFGIAYTVRTRESFFTSLGFI
ncbi:hypothetical protein PR048_006355 [Dryococelus australis]|uniref:Uncharacterized protein n=1 Tax=Dryococelus australis TaxID=614101 RepID=A0ABQ9IC29_9NEOP|nr:hypothetical protein PR048_006355 [Dryococelus australis]